MKSSSHNVQIHGESEQQKSAEITRKKRKKTMKNNFLVKMNVRKVREYERDFFIYLIENMWHFSGFSFYYICEQKVFFFRKFCVLMCAIPKIS